MKAKKETKPSSINEAEDPEEQEQQQSKTLSEDQVVVEGATKMPIQQQYHLQAPQPPTQAENQYYAPNSSNNPMHVIS